ncbi:MAG TPA: hypothetical protein VH572_11290 [Gaiella sp.]
MGVLPECPFCGGAGAVAFETGPAVEPCSECRGTGRLVARWHGVFAALLHEKGVLLDTEMRLLLVALDELEQRVDALDRSSRERGGGP